MDDEELVRKVAGKMLEFLGYQVVMAREGREAIALFESHRAAGSPFDAVLLDLLVPGGLDGADTLAELLRLDPQVKAIISSGFGDSAAPTEGALASISKPYELKRLGETMDRVMAASHA